MLLAVPMKMKAHRTEIEPDKVYLDTGKPLHFISTQQPK